MNPHHIKFAWFRFHKQKLFSFINVFGLATAMAVCLLIFLFVTQELRFDRFHEDAQNIHRIHITMDIQGDVRHEAVTSYPMGADIMDNFPEVLDITRMSYWNSPVNIWQGDQYTTVDRAPFAESSFFDLFSFRLTQGNPATVLEEPFSLVLSETLANNLFPEGNAMGQLLRLNNQERFFRITGIIEDSPDHSIIQYDMLRSYASLLETSTSNFEDWDANIGLQTYVKLAEGTDLNALHEKTKDLTYEKINYKFEGMGANVDLSYFPMTRIRLYSSFSNESVETGTINKVWMFSAVAVFVLFIAGFNYVNLTIAQAGKRAKEVGMRKVLGAHGKVLSGQFFVETLMMTGISFLGGILVTELLLPVFNNLMETNLSLLSMPWWGWVACLMVFVTSFAYLAGLYPSWYMSSFQPVKILKGEYWKKPGRFNPKNMLMLLQCVTAIALITCTLVVFLQIRHLTRMDLGFKAEGLVSVYTEEMEDARLLGQQLTGFPWHQSQSISSTIPAMTIYQEGVAVNGQEPGILTQRLWVDHHYSSNMQLSLAEGRFFDRDDGLETENVLINQAFARKAGLNDPLGITISREGVDYTIIGVVKDYHMLPLQHEVDPLLINTMEDRPAYASGSQWLNIRINDTAHSDVLNAIQNTWETLFPNQTFTYYFIDDRLRDAYDRERNFGRVFLGFTILAILIALLGVLGLSALAARQRQKEMGIRKVLGASVISLLVQASREFTLWIALSAVIAMPLAYWFLSEWLGRFPYPIDFPYWTMLVAGIGMLLVSLGIVGTQSLQSARVNPVKTLKYE